MSVNEVHGNCAGIKRNLLEEIAQLYSLRLESSQFASFELLSMLACFTGQIGREISVYIARDGHIADVSIGDSGKVTLVQMRLVRNADRLCGVRCIHTHPGGDGRLSSVDIGTLRSMRLDAMAALGVKPDGSMTSLYVGFLGELQNEERQVLLCGPLRPYKLPHVALLQEIEAADERLKSSTKEVTQAAAERAILVGLENNDGYDTLGELGELAKTAGAVVVGRALQKRRDVDNATYIGSGKADELSLMGSALEADLFVFDDELNPAQTKNLEKILGTRVIDRTALILDIFAKHAQSREGKLQVELAQLKYELPRIMGKGIALSRQGSGAIARGPGETKLENDRRRIRRRIYELEQELGEIDKQRGLRRTQREKNTVPLVALVGYTNAGKSTLLNALTGAGVLAEDKLFATLDPVVRQTALEDGTQILLSDTVGFINKLPHDLIEAFRSTLDEVRSADLILHVIDVSSDYYDKQIEIVEEVLCKLGAGETRQLRVYNKIDAVTELPVKKKDCFLISAKSGTGVAELLQAMGEILNAEKRRIDLLIPYEKYEVISLIRAEGRILSEEHEEMGTRVCALVEEKTMWKLRKLLDIGKDEKNEHH